MFGIHLVNDVSYDGWHMRCVMYGKCLVYDVSYEVWQMWSVVCGLGHMSV